MPDPHDYNPLPSSPADLARPTSDDEVVARITDALHAWLSTSLSPSGTLFRSTLEVQQVEALVILEMTLRSLSETRSMLSERQVTPYRGEPIPPRAITDPLQIDLGKYPCEAPAGFEERRTRIAVPESFRISRCLECQGKQRAICERCQGSRWQGCPTCEGKGQGACVICQGTGRQTCLACQGKRTTPSQGAVKACPACQGQGVSRCPRCTDGLRECSQCHGVGRIACAKCLGQGTIVCRVCEGQGQLLNALAFNVLWRPSVEVERVVPEGLPRQFLTTHEVPGDPSIVVWEGKAFTAGDIEHLPGWPDFLRESLGRLFVRVQEGLVSMPGTETVRQQLTIVRRRFYRVSYRAEHKAYQVWCLAPTWEIVAQETPASEAVKEEITRADAAFARGELTASLAHLDVARRLEPAHPRLDDLLGRIHRRLAWQTAAWGALGGMAAGGLAAVIVRIIGRKGLHWVWPVAGALLSGLALGFVMGWWLPRCQRVWQRHTRPLPWKWASGISAGVVILAQAALCQALGWNPVRWTDQRWYHTVIHQQFPYGLPTVPWPNDLQFLDAVIRRYEPAGVDVRTEQLLLTVLTKRAEEAAKRRRSPPATLHPPKRRVTLQLPAAHRVHRKRSPQRRRAW